MVKEVKIIPKDWKIVQIGDHFDFKNGLNKAKIFFGQGTPIINYMDVYPNPAIYAKNIHGKVTVSNDEQRAFEIRKGDVLFTRTSETIEEIGLSSVVLDGVKKTVFSGFLLRARPTTEFFELEFKKYCFRSNNIRKQIISTSSQTTRALTNGKLLSKISILIPIDPQEQLSIAESISNIEQLIDKFQTIIVKKKNIKEGTIQELLTGKKRLSGFEKKQGTKLSTLGIIPKDWKTDEIQNHAIITTGKKNTQDQIENGEFPFFVRSQKMEKINTYSYDGEAVLTAGDGDIGKVFHYINAKFDFHQRVYMISDFDNQLDGYFFYLFFTKNFLKRVMTMTAKSTVDSIRMDMIAKMFVFLPEIKEQIAIGKIIHDMDSEIKELETKKEKYIMIKNGMMQKLLTGEIRLT
jgi:type I restriction enzyme, S subunit